MGFFASSQGQQAAPAQKLNAYNIIILLLLAPGSIAYGYSAAIIATTLGRYRQFLSQKTKLTNKTGQPSFIEYFSLATRPNATSLIGATSGLFFAGGTIGPLLLPAITDRWGRKWGIAIVR